jgi:site-specific DNA recombinase
MPGNALAIVRVSQANGREEAEGFASPGIQRDRITGLCEREGLNLAGVFEEIDVGGSKPLDKRPGLSAALAEIEAGHAQVLVVAYFDRLVRSLDVQTILLKRVEKAGGRIMSADIGEVSHDTTANWLNATMHGMMAEYHNRITAEKTRAAQVRAIERGIPPIILPPGLVRTGDRIELDPDRGARGRGGCQDARGRRDRQRDPRVPRRQWDPAQLPRNHDAAAVEAVGRRDRVRQVGGEVRSHRRPATWERAQAVSVPRGRRAKSERLLARLGVLRCGTCGARMVVGTANHGRYALYRCPPTGDCPQRMTVSAELVEGLVTDAVRAALEGMVGRASADTDAQAAETALERAQADMDAAIRAFAGVQDEPVALERIGELRAATGCGA